MFSPPLTQTEGGLLRCKTLDKVFGVLYKKHKKMEIWEDLSRDMLSSAGKRQQSDLFCNTGTEKTNGNI